MDRQYYTKLTKLSNVSSFTPKHDSFSLIFLFQLVFNSSILAFHSSFVRSPNVGGKQSECVRTITAFSHISGDN